MYRAIAANRRASVLLIVIFVVFIVVLAEAILAGFAALQGSGGPTDRDFLTTFTSLQHVAAFFLLAAIVQVAVAFGSASSLFVRGMEPVTQEGNPALWRVVENIAITAGTPMPAIYVCDEQAPNAFAIGRKPEKASIGVTQGMLDLLADDPSALDGVIAVQIARIQNQDIRVTTLLFGLMAGLTAIVDLVTFRGSRRLLVLRLAVSRQRVYLADANSVMLMRYPDGLERALHALDGHEAALERSASASSETWMLAPAGRATFLDRVFSTHPSPAARAARLHARAETF